MEINIKDLAKLHNYANERKVRSAENVVQRHEDAARSYEGNMNEYKHLMEEYKKYAEDAKKDVEKTKEDAEKSLKLHKQKAQKTANNLAKHKGVQSVSCKGSVVTITTPLLFCDIREKAGSKVVERTCIGAYECSMDFSRNLLTVKNLLFSRHWAIDDNARPCLGEFQSEVARALETQDIYALFDCLYHLLLSANLDGAAFMRSHDWRQNYRYLSTHTFSMGDYVVAVANADLSLQGRVGVVLRVRGGAPEVGFKEVPNLVSQVNWNVPPYVLAPITEKQFRAAGIYKLEQSTSLSKLDTLKEGTLEDAKKLLEKGTKVKLLPYEAPTN